jgi:hypothetical protein
MTCDTARRVVTISHGQQHELCCCDAFQAPCSCCCREGREDRYYIVQNKQQAREAEAKAAKDRRKKVGHTLTS